MIEDYRALAVFVAVADAGSFSSAARRLTLSTSVVSHHLARLETKLGVPLFFRSTRSLALSPEGQAILDHARRMVEAGEAALDALAMNDDQPSGSLRISLPAFGFQGPLHQSVWDFSKRYPLVSISVNFNDRPADLVKDRFDLAIRLGVVPDSSLKCRRIDDFHRVLVAAPEYIHKHGKLDSIDTLQDCDFISISMLSDKHTLIKDGKAVSFEPAKTRIEVDSASAAKSAVMAGLGVRQLPLEEVRQELEDGKLVHLMPKWSVPLEGVFAVWPDIGPQKTLTRMLIDHMADWQTQSAKTA
ncbi:MAG: LysR family transcriptional regulator [Pseudomonadota bacterium]